MGIDAQRGGREAANTHNSIIGEGLEKKVLQKSCAARYPRPPRDFESMPRQAPPRCHTFGAPAGRPRAPPTSVEFRNHKS